jgi:hypothetical protein
MGNSQQIARKGTTEQAREKYCPSENEVHSDARARDEEVSVFLY